MATIKKKATAKKATTRSLSPLEKKLAELRTRLLDSNIKLPELERLRVHTDLLENALSAATNDHHHDTNQHHDHDYLIDPTSQVRIPVRR